MDVLELIHLSVKTNQEAFDKVVAHLGSMKERALMPEKPGRPVQTCAYETEDGKARCAIGALMILDTPTKHEWAKGTAGGVEDIVHDLDPDWPDIDPAHRLDLGEGLSIDLLRRLQETHDVAVNWNDDGFERWGILFSIAEEWDLNTNAIP